MLCLSGLLALVFLTAPGLQAADPEPWLGNTPAAPPPAPPIVTTKAPAAADAPVMASMAGLTLYSIGEPTDHEQMFVELINRARANPTQEGQILRDLTDPDVVGAYNYFNVNLDQMAADMATLGPTPPLSINALLTVAARNHSLDMLTNNFQGHTGSNGSSPGNRLTAAGYSWNTYGENVYASAKSVIHGHAGFEVDWGNGPEGMQSPPGHRLNTHSSNFREIGVGVILGSNGGVGPQLVTQDLARRSGLSPFITGVVYYDFNSNGSYDLGEGLGGVDVTVSGSSYYAVTAGSGGYSVPVPASTTPTVTFAAAGLPDHIVNVTVDTSNVKVDFVPAYSPPVISGPPTSTVGQPNAHQFTAVGGATDYEWEQSVRVPFTDIEGAESGLNDMTTSVSAGYALVTGDLQASGSSSFHLAHPPSPQDQTLTWTRLLRLGAASTLSFQSRLGWATSRQVARVQISVHGGSSWEEIWSRPGTGDGGQNSFNTVTVSLAAHAGMPAQFRFVYDYTSGSYYPQTQTGTGWYFDDITVTDAEELVASQRSNVGGGNVFSFDFIPGTAGDYSLRTRAQVGGKTLEWGPPFLTSAVAPSLAFKLDSIPVIAGGRAEFDVEIMTGTPGTFVVESAPTPQGPWTVDPTATVQTLVNGTRYRLNAAAGDGVTAYFRVRSE